MTRIRFVGEVWKVRHKWIVRLSWMEELGGESRRRHVRETRMNDFKAIP